ncbi:hypothetical protein [Mesorhizobium sp.]|uniref:hypothetical protein n=1 Tax=Mesorhizobium sp. TaxID=1871066 RepID=UPI0011F7EB79|nr:hypothetical protein [Mesorhizobium sp.]TIL30167.1 MAG: hypothetical protein E5Y85_25275 [Mesorhizobium sp.]
MTKKTPLFAIYQSRNAKMRDAGGFFTPAAFSDMAEEHKAARETVGHFALFELRLGDGVVAYGPSEGRLWTRPRRDAEPEFPARRRQ